MAIKDNDNVTIFNSALASLERLHKLLISCNEYSIMCRIPHNDIFIRVQYMKTWQFLVEKVYDEISPKLKRKEGRKMDMKFKKIKSLPNPIYNRRTEDGYVPMLNTKVFDEYAAHISKMERLLRYLADKKGMLIPDKTEDLLEPQNW